MRELERLQAIHTIDLPTTLFADALPHARPRGGKQPGEFFQGEEPNRLGRRAGHGLSLDRKATAQITVLSNSAGVG
jgi:hypothetical protein